MKAFSVRQPWAWLIVHNHKPLENRTRRTHYRGLIAVHASLQFDHAGYAWVKQNHPHIKMPAPEEFERGGVVGEFEIVACIEPGDAKLLTSRDAPWYMPAEPPAKSFAWILENAAPFRFMPCRGQLGFFEVDL